MDEILAMQKRGTRFAVILNKFRMQLRYAFMALLS